jgi:hypothetical protein
MLQEKRDPNGGDESGNARRLAHRQISATINGDTQKTCHENGYRERDPPWQGKNQNPVAREIAANHQNITMGEIDYAKDPIDHGVPNGHESVKTAEGDSVYELLEQNR